MNLKKTSKFLSLVLRHKPETIGIELDVKGWVDVDDLLDGLSSAGHTISRQDLERVVKDNDKQRFVIADGRIRANQGHSVDIDLDIEALTPPVLLYHGTATRFLESILAQGLIRMSRQHVHLSSDETTAVRVGQRHGKPVVLRVDSKRMYEDGFEFFRSKNGVGLVESVPATYLQESS